MLGIKTYTKGICEGNHANNLLNIYLIWNLQRIYRIKFFLVVFTINERVFHIQQWTSSNIALIKLLYTIYINKICYLNQFLNKIKLFLLTRNSPPLPSSISSTYPSTNEWFGACQATVTELFSAEQSSGIICGGRGAIEIKKIWNH